MKHNLPIRQCIGCRKKYPKEELIRFVSLPSGQIVFDRNCRLEGRGNYLCPDKECFDRASKGKFIQESLRTKEKRTEMLNSVRTELEESIEVRVRHGGKMYSSTDDDATIENIMQGDIVIITDNCRKIDLNSINAMALRKGALIYRVPVNVLKDKHACILKSEYFLRSQLIHDLRLLERLSSKGLTV
ncbi:MAG: YlxR family protein [Deltaproteobacteria bacterium]|nr:YlxR family protein [Deltaproteobacteria bacterium]